MGKLRVAVLFGGCSEEHDVSVKSAKQIASGMDPDRYAPYFIYINKTGEWMLLCGQPGEDVVGSEWLPCGRSGGEVVGAGRARAVISPDRSDHGILVRGKDGYEKIYIDVVFPVIHGKMGEDGQLQGLLEMSGIPYVGCDVESSVLAMDKSLAYLVARIVGVATPEFRVVHGADEVGEALIDAARFAYPVFVKPTRSGSSFGVSKVRCAAELEGAVEHAQRYDGKVLIEEAVSGREVGCAVMGNGDGLLTGEIDMITLAHGFFKIHQEKNPEAGSENAKVTVPADIPKETGERVRDVAKKVYRALGCSGLARVDMFLREDGEIVLNEVNTMPGCTSYSRYPAMMAAAGISLPEWIDRVIALALAR